MRIPGIRIECLIAILRQNTYMHEQITKGLVYAFGERKYLNEYTPFESVSLCTEQRDVNRTGHVMAHLHRTSVQKEWEYELTGWMADNNMAILEVLIYGRAVWQLRGPPGLFEAILLFQQNH